MKHIYSLILVIIFSNNMHSQSWTPINTSDKYNYKINNNDTIACTIFVDSIKVYNTPQNQDSINKYKFVNLKLSNYE